MQESLLSSSSAATTTGVGMGVDIDNAAHTVAATVTATATTTAPRWQWTDRTRGLLMVFMALDHASFFIGKSTHLGGETWGGVWPSYASNALGASASWLFITRFVTNACAPGFIFFMGLSMALLLHARQQAGWKLAQVRNYFFLRGAVLLALQFTIENFAWSIGSPYFLNGFTPVYFGVLFALGMCMLTLTLFLSCSWQTLLLLLVPLHILAQGLVPSAWQWGQEFPLLSRVLWTPSSSQNLEVFYVVMPWLSVAFLGLATGKLLLARPQLAPRLLRRFAVGALALYVPLKLWGGEFFNLRTTFNDESAWYHILFATKYPPSTTYMLLQLGIVAAFASLFLRQGQQIQLVQQKKFSILEVLGQNALFFYLAHLYVYALLGLIFPAGNLSLVYLAWVLGLAILIPLCPLFNNFKRKQGPQSLWRLL